MKQRVILIATSFALSAVAAPRHAAGQAVDTLSDAVACRGSVTASYGRCALWVDGSKVRRGQEGVVVGRPGFFRPMALTRIVTGDSAMSYAALFEHRTRQSNLLGIAGGALTAAGLIILEGRPCQPTFFGCDHRDNGDWVGGSLLVPGLLLGIVSGAIQGRAERAKAKAVWWNNKKFAR